MGYGHLGQETVYAEQYDAGLLFPIARAHGRAEIAQALPSFYGADVWHGYEISWLDAQGKPQAACARFVLPCDSPFLIESKSFKLYLNSYNQTSFDHWDQVAESMRADLSQACGGAVLVTLMPLASLVCQPWSALAGECIDDLPIAIDQYNFSDGFLSVSGDVVSEQLVSYLLKSNCPVTNQPDWGSVQISYTGQQIDREGLLRMIVSLRQHQGFHEQCVEQLFASITEKCQPEKLSVLACYTRRGGLDINPYRSSESGDLPDWGRVVRQ